MVLQLFQDPVSAILDHAPFQIGVGVQNNEHLAARFGRSFVERTAFAKNLAVGMADNNFRFRQLAFPIFKQPVKTLFAYPILGRKGNQKANFWARLHEKNFLSASKTSKISDCLSAIRFRSTCWVTPILNGRPIEEA